MIIRGGFVDGNFRAIIERFSEFGFYWVRSSSVFVVDYGYSSAHSREKYFRVEFIFFRLGVFED